MSTRATIQIKKSNKKDVWVYHHYDGDMIGEEIKDFLKSLNEEWNPAEIAVGLYQMDESYELTNGQHGDEEYKYVIDCDNRIIRCYKLDFDGSIKLLYG